MVILNPDSTSGASYQNAQAAFRLPIGPVVPAGQAVRVRTGSGVEFLYLDPAFTGPAVEIGVTLPSGDVHVMRPGSLLPFDPSWAQFTIWSPVAFDPTELNGIEMGGWFRFLGVTAAEAAVLASQQPGSPMGFVSMLGRYQGSGAFAISTLHLRALRFTVVAMDAGGLRMAAPADLNVTIDQRIGSRLKAASLQTPTENRLGGSPAGALNVGVATLPDFYSMNAGALLTFTQNQLVRELAVVCPAPIVLLVPSLNAGTGVANIYATVEGW
jgi:hypothetical protein